MNVATLETRPLYGIGTVARLTRVRPETLRIWERRYGLGASQKADNGRRLYTQTDLEHLQIVVKLVEQGFRIGEIASMERKTLEAMLEQGGGSSGHGAKSEAKPRVLFVGNALCSWLDQHPGCLTSLDSQLYRGAVEDVATELTADLDPVDLLVLDCAALNAEQVEAIKSLRERVHARSALVFYQFSSQRWLSQLNIEGISATKLPLDTETFAAHMKRLQGTLEVERGVSDAGELARPRSRLFKDEELLEHLKVDSALACGCTQHLAEIIQSLAAFEQYSSQCAVESWSDAATHTCVYAYTSQARWLMEKALKAVLEEHASHG
ncbi:MAG: MerR family transcriptional regulator [Halieaceae bacterium]|jgi:DNA-binding transcriptional MerR regulator|nr:MerR family transcriptional regulator [Halieaceae bacterium]